MSIGIARLRNGWSMEVFNWSRWPELNRRPTPSFTPQFRKTYMGTRLYLWHILSDLATLVSRSGDCSPRSYPPRADFDRNSGFIT